MTRHQQEETVITFPQSSQVVGRTQRHSRRHLYPADLECLSKRQQRYSTVTSKRIRQLKKYKLCIISRRTSITTLLIQDSDALYIASKQRYGPWSVISFLLYFPFVNIFGSWWQNTCLLFCIFWLSLRRAHGMCIYRWLAAHLFTVVSDRGGGEEKKHISIFLQYGERTPTVWF